MTSRDVRERDTRSSTLIAALPAIDRARQRFFNWQEKIRIVAVARLCYPGVRDEPFPIVKNHLTQDSVAILDAVDATDTTRLLRP